MDSNRDKTSELGQSIVEYILLLAVVSSIAFTIFKGLGFDRIFGANGELATSYRNQLEFSYRHGFGKNINNEPPPDYNSGRHESYQGRLFGAKDTYPSQ